MEIIKVSVGSAVRLGAQSSNGLPFSLIQTPLPSPHHAFCPLSPSNCVQSISLSLVASYYLSFASTSLHPLPRYLAVVPPINAFHSTERPLDRIHPVVPPVLRQSAKRSTELILPLAITFVSTVYYRCYATSCFLSI